MHLPILAAILEATTHSSHGDGQNAIDGICDIINSIFGAETQPRQKRDDGADSSQDNIFTFSITISDVAISRFGDVAVGSVSVERGSTSSSRGGFETSPNEKEFLVSLDHLLEAFNERDWIGSKSFRDLTFRLLNTIRDGCGSGQDGDAILLGKDNIAAMIGVPYLLDRYSVEHITYDAIPIELIRHGSAIYSVGNSNKLLALPAALLYGVKITTNGTKQPPKHAQISAMAVAILKTFAPVSTDDSADGTLIATALGAQFMHEAVSTRMDEVQRGGSLTSDELEDGDRDDPNESFQIAQCFLMNQQQAKDATQSQARHSENGSNIDIDELWTHDQILHMETNLDDTTGEHLGFVIELLMKAGALDAWAAPIIMKKGRPAHTLHCLCSKSAADAQMKRRTLTEIMFRHTTTLGIRIYDDLKRVKLKRSFVTVELPGNNSASPASVDVKIGQFRNGEIVSAKAEYDHCKVIAESQAIPIQMVANQATQLALQEHRKQQSDP